MDSDTMIERTLALTMQGSTDPPDVQVSRVEWDFDDYGQPSARRSHTRTPLPAATRSQ